MAGRTTKKAMAFSLLSLLLCCAMLIGTTFAWFTDSVTSGNNRIIAGKLDVELEFATAFDADGNPTAWDSVEHTENLFRPAQTEDTLWEPGHTEVVYLRVRNAGNLALKYNLSAAVYGDTSGAPEKVWENQAGEAFKLSEYLVLNTIPDTATKLESREDAWLTDGQAAEEAVLGKLDSISGQDVILNKGEEKVFTLAVYVPTWVGNEANHKTGTDAPEIYVGLTLAATQAAVESDSFGNTYDESAAYPDGEQAQDPETPDYTDSATLLKGQELDVMMKKAAGGTSSTTFRSANTSITSITFSVYDEAAVGTPWEEGVSVDEDGAGKIRMFVSGDNTKIDICVQPDTQIVMNADSSWLFASMQALTAIDFGGDLVSTSEVTNMDNLFYTCKKLGMETFAQTEAWDVSKVTDMGGMYRGCTLLTEIDLSNWNTSSLESISCMFMGDTALTAVDVSGWDVSKVGRMDNAFANCYLLTAIEGLSGWNADNVTNIDYMFQGCEVLPELDLSGFHTQGLTTLKFVFTGCKALRTIEGLENWDTSGIADMSSLFSGCQSLIRLDLSGFVTDRTTTLASMFSSCKELTAVTGLDSWDTSNVTTMGSMFSGCTAIPALDLSGWDMTKVKNISAMFQNCSAMKELTITGWTIQAGTTATYAFNRCSVLERIYTDRDWNLTGTSSGIFNDCFVLTGGEGTQWVKNTHQNNANYTRVDRSGTPGLFTDVAKKG